MSDPAISPAWIQDLQPDGPANRSSHRGYPLPLWTVPLGFEAWPHDEPPSLAMNCRKRSSLVLGAHGKSCPEVEAVTRLRDRGWSAYWLRSFRCGPASWQRLRGDAGDLPQWVVAVLQEVRRRRRIPDRATGVEPLGGIPDVIAYQDDPRALVFVECKRPAEPLDKQRAWLEAALPAGRDRGVIGYDQIVVAVSSIRQPHARLPEGARIRVEGGNRRSAAKPTPEVERIDNPPDLVAGGGASVKASETYRGFTIYYEASTRRWFVDLHPGEPQGEFNSAFQARRAINVVLDGHSVAWPRREGR